MSLRIVLKLGSSRSQGKLSKLNIAIYNHAEFMQLKLLIKCIEFLKNIAMAIIIIVTLFIILSVHLILIFDSHISFLLFLSMRNYSEWKCLTLDLWFYTIYPYRYLWLLVAEWKILGINYFVSNIMSVLLKLFLSTKRSIIYIVDIMYVFRFGIYYAQYNILDKNLNVLVVGNNN